MTPNDPEVIARELSPRLVAVLSRLDDIWQHNSELWLLPGAPGWLVNNFPKSSAELRGSLVALRHRGLAIYRPGEDVDMPNEWASTELGDAVNDAAQKIRGSR